MKKLTLTLGILTLSASAFASDAILPLPLTGCGVGGRELSHVDRLVPSYTILPLAEVLHIAPPCQGARIHKILVQAWTYEGGPELSLTVNGRQATVGQLVPMGGVTPLEFNVTDEMLAGVTQGQEQQVGDTLGGLGLKFLGTQVYIERVGVEWATPAGYVQAPAQGQGL